MLKSRKRSTDTSGIARAGAHTIGHGSVGLGSDKLRISAFASNLFDERFGTYTPLFAVLQPLAHRADINDTSPMTRFGRLQPVCFEALTLRNGQSHAVRQTSPPPIWTGAVCSRHYSKGDDSRRRLDQMLRPSTAAEKAIAE